MMSRTFPATKPPVSGLMPCARLRSFHFQYGEHIHQPLGLGIVAAESRGVGVGQGTIDMEADVLGTPRVWETHVEQVRRHRQLRNDAGRVEQIGSVTGHGEVSDPMNSPAR
jgi:hypothetical protein